MIEPEAVRDLFKAAPTPPMPEVVETREERDGSVYISKRSKRDTDSRNFAQIRELDSNPSSAKDSHKASNANNRTATPNQVELKKFDSSADDRHDSSQNLQRQISRKSSKGSSKASPKAAYLRKRSKVSQSQAAMDYPD